MVLVRLNYSERMRSETVAKGGRFSRYSSELVSIGQLVLPGEGKKVYHRDVPINIHCKLFLLRFTSIDLSVLYSKMLFMVSMAF